MRLETPGGGGYGAAAERDAADVARDVARGIDERRPADARLWHRLAGGIGMSGARMIGVDVGGTFTDVFVLNEADGQRCGGQGADNPARPVGRISGRDRRAR